MLRLSTFLLSFEESVNSRNSLPLWQQMQPEFVKNGFCVRMTSRLRQEKEEAEQREILRPDGPAVTTLLLKRLLDRILASAAKDYGIQVTENQQNLLFAEVYHYTDYLIERMMKEALKNGSDCEAKE